MQAIIATLVAMTIGLLEVSGMVHWITLGTRNVQNAVAASQLVIFDNAAAEDVAENSATFMSTATTTTPVTVTVAQLVAAGYLPNGFTAKNSFGQTLELQVLKSATGTLQPLVISTGPAITNQLQLVQVAAQAGAQGGFIPYANQGGSGMTSSSAYGTYGAWQVSLTGYTNPGPGHIASLLAFNSALTNNDYLYRNQVAGQPQLNEMNTNIGMNGNDITNVGQLQAASGVGVTIGSTQFYGDGTNTSIRQNGTLSIQDLAGSAYAPLEAANVTANGDLYATGNVTAASGNVVAGGAIEGDLLYSTGNAAVVGNATVNGTVQAGGDVGTNGYFLVNGPATLGAACPGPQYIGAGANGPLLCENGVWSSGATPPGTACGLVTDAGQDGSLCQGYNAYAACPPGWSRIHWLVPGFGSNSELAFCTQESVTGGNMGD